MAIGKYISPYRVYLEVTT